jgi:hypothetical protein
MKRIVICSIFLLFSLLGYPQLVETVTVVDRPSTEIKSSCYPSWRAPLQQAPFMKLPVGSIQPHGWLRKMLLLQRDGLTGHLGEISSWLSKYNNAWLTNGGDHGWEEVPYWLKGYGDLAYILHDEGMIKEAKTWIDAVIASQRSDGFFGPENKRGDKPELWAQMIMLWVLQSYYEYTGDERVVNLMPRYFNWELSLPDNVFLKDYWENSRGGDNLWSVLWLYNRTGKPELLSLAEKIHRNTANWHQSSNLPNWHNVNIAQCFREPAIYYMLNGDASMMQAAYNNQQLVRRIFGQVPGGMFGGNENCRLGYVDPRQCVETCGMVEQMASDEIMLCLTGDTYWADNCEDVAFNSYPAAVMPDFRSLRYLTAPNMVVSDSRNHAPGIQNEGPFLAMNPFSSRCCQHNHTQGWPYYTEHLVLATADNGVAMALYGANSTRMWVGKDRKEVLLTESTRYPFEEDVEITINMKGKVSFPLYLRIPTWAAGALLSINGQVQDVKALPGGYFRIERQWRNGDRVSLHLPMRLHLRQWVLNKNSVSLDYGPLTFSLLIEERQERKDSRSSAIFDSSWQESADATSWPTTELYPTSPWNYALCITSCDETSAFSIEKRPWPSDNYPFTDTSVPLIIKANGRLVPSWTIDEYGLCGILPNENAPQAAEQTPITLIPMGAARLRISAFPKAIR